jgi:hypothetical protein
MKLDDPQQELTAIGRRNKMLFKPETTIEKAIVGIIGIIVIGLTAIILDNVMGSEQTMRGMVADKEYHPAYTTFQTQTDAKGNITGQIPVHHPERFIVVISNTTQELDCKTYEKQYDRVELRMTANVTYTKGGLFGGEYCEHFRLEQE